MKLNELLLTSSVHRVILLALVAITELGTVGLVAVDSLFTGQGNPIVMLLAFAFVLVCGGVQLFLLIRMRNGGKGVSIDIGRAPFKGPYLVWAVTGVLVPLIATAAMMAFSGTEKSVVEQALAVIALVSVLVGLGAWNALLSRAASRTQEYLEKHTKKRSR